MPTEGESTGEGLDGLVTDERCSWLFEGGHTRCCGAICSPTSSMSIERWMLTRSTSCCSNQTSITDLSELWGTLAASTELSGEMDECETSGHIPQTATFSLGGLSTMWAGRRSSSQQFRISLGNMTVRPHLQPVAVALLWYTLSKAESMSFCRRLLRSFLRSSFKYTSTCTPTHIVSIVSGTQLVESHGVHLLTTSQYLSVCSQTLHSVLSVAQFLVASAVIIQLHLRRGPSFGSTGPGGIPRLSRQGLGGVRGPGDAARCSLVTVDLRHFIPILSRRILYASSISSPRVCRRSLPLCSAVSVLGVDMSVSQGQGGHTVRTLLPLSRKVETLLINMSPPGDSLVLTRACLRRTTHSHIRSLRQLQATSWCERPPTKGGDETTPSLEAESGSSDESVGSSGSIPVSRCCFIGPYVWTPLERRWTETSVTHLSCPKEATMAARKSSMVRVARCLFKHENNTRTTRAKYTAQIKYSQRTSKILAQYETYTRTVRDIYSHSTSQILAQYKSNTYTVRDIYSHNTSKILTQHEPNTRTVQVKYLHSTRQIHAQHEPNTRTALAK
uniref:Uncharacterized protein n=1 Tax=Timema genevievae TaxID=629358 RepID=A0A7R9PPP4_TIMGE|nr:unnamed protein product [Timema genevievae]